MSVHVGVCFSTDAEPIIVVIPFYLKCAIINDNHTIHNTYNMCRCFGGETTSINNEITRRTFAVIVILFTNRYNLLSIGGCPFPRATASKYDGRISNPKTLITS